ncbi:MAG: hypothetical protein ACTSPY_02215 [Candidatus Helarchaeota archaeon]
MIKKRDIIFLLMFITSCILLIGSSRSQTNYLWGINLDDSNIYMISETYTGSIDLVNELPMQSFKIIGLDNFNGDINNYFDVYMQFQTKVEGNVIRNFTYYYDNFAYNKSQYLYNLTFKFQNITTFISLLPIAVNESSHQGFNWTKAINEINSLKDFNVSKIINIITVKSNGGKFYDNELKTNYTMEGSIVWDLYSGWLISYDIKRNYEAPLDYTYRLYIYVFSSSRIFFIDWNYVISGISISIGVIGVILALWMINKSKHNNEKEKKNEEK